MTSPLHRRPPAVVALVMLVTSVAACASAAPSVAPSATPSPASTTAVLPSPTPTVSASATPSPLATPVATPVASASAAACDFRPQTGALPSDRLTGMEVLRVPGRDIVRFTFGNASLSPAGPPSGSLTVAVPPFTEGASGRPIDLQGEHALQFVLRGMSLQNDLGQPTFDGEREIRATASGRSLRHLIMFDESDGQIGWYIGYDGSSCVTTTREGNDVLVLIDFGRAG